jgi:hypothetical protein
MHISKGDNVITHPLTGFDTDQALAVVRQALDTITGRLNEHDANEINTAMSWIAEGLEDTALSEGRVIRIEWGIEDVQSLDCTLTDEEAREVLSAVKQRHDCNIGITWDFIQFYVDDYNAAWGGIKPQNTEGDRS